MLYTGHCATLSYTHQIVIPLLTVRTWGCSCVHVHQGYNIMHQLIIFRLEQLTAMGCNPCLSDVHYLPLPLALGDDAHLLFYPIHW